MVPRLGKPPRLNLENFTHQTRQRLLTKAVVASLNDAQLHYVINELYRATRIYLSFGASNQSAVQRVLMVPPQA